MWWLQEVQVMLAWRHVKMGGPFLKKHQTVENIVIATIWDTAVWMIVIVTLIVFGISLHLVMKLDNNIKKLKYRSPLSKTYWIAFKSFVGQGINLTIFNGIPSKILVGIWIFSSLVLMLSYSGTLTSFLTSPIYEDVPTTFNELSSVVETGEYDCGTVYSGQVYFITTNSKVSYILERHIHSRHHFLSENELVDKLKNSKFALIRSYTYLKRMAKDYNLEDFKYSKDALITFPSGYASRKGFPWIKNISKIIRNLFESGIINKIEDLEISEELRTTEFSPLSFEEIISPLALLMFGYMLSIICVIFELILVKYYRR
ncbi:glutamate receptor ionotropic, kainate glr-3-like [Centruroides vittatus]|uniref:glutamate receptor ionotropic, kainate glr-3-like n=1 Tax=Centruroides vittatus TaxID=120091 RepID=UPI00351042C6